MQRESLRHKAKHELKRLESATYEAFLSDVLQGLSQPQKSLPCKWLYDEYGAMLFEEITQTPEYYLTRTETRLLRKLGQEIAHEIPNLKILIEPGSGSSVKTRLLLQALPTLEQYIPIDISEEMLLDAAEQLQQEFPALRVQPHVHDFSMPVPPLLRFTEEGQRLVFFPGSTIGNFSPKEAQRLLRSFDALVRHDGWLLLGVDTTRDKHIVLPAYDDTAGITAQFNMNLLVRINRELEANFNPARFRHKAIFNSLESRIEMHLVSQQAQTVQIAGHMVVFEPGESIHTENCYKYPLATVERMAQACGWELSQTWTDETGTGFVVILFKSAR